MPLRRLSEDDAQLLARCARALIQSVDADPRETAGFIACAAAGNRDAQLCWGLKLARMDIDGRRIADAEGSANYKNAIRWLTLAGEQGSANAWFAIYQIYLKSEFSQRNVAEAQNYLGKAAAAGYREAQTGLGLASWRTRGKDQSREILAAYWLQKAAAQACELADSRLKNIALAATPVAWAQAVLQHVAQDAGKVPPDLMARIELAARFGLSRAEALLLDENKADCRHCLAIDIRAHHVRSKRCLILISTEQERLILDRIVRSMGSETSVAEGSYRQRLYRLKAACGAHDCVLLNRNILFEH